MQKHIFNKVTVLVVLINKEVSDLVAEKPKEKRV